MRVGSCAYRSIHPDGRRDEVRSSGYPNGTSQRDAPARGDIDVGARTKRLSARPADRRPVTAASATGKHTVDPLEPDDDLLESLYVINKVAKRLADEASDAYDRGDVTRSNVSSARKDALYRTKTTVLSRIVAHDPSLVEGEYHAINGDVWLLLRVNGWAFHQPPYAFGSELTDRIELVNDPDEPLDVPYVRESAVERSDQSLETALVRLADHGVDANDHLDRPTISGERDQLVDVRWSCLR